MGIEKISQSDTHVLHVCLDENRPYEVLFRIEDARTRNLLARAHLSLGDARDISQSILDVIDEIHDNMQNE